MKRRWLALTLLAAFAGGCATAPDPFPIWKLWGLDLAKQEDGSVLVPDTPGNWKRLSRLFTDEVKREAAGLPPTGGFDTWPAFWHKSFTEIRANHEHPEKYFALILNLRREESLPDLPRSALAP